MGEKRVLMVLLILIGLSVLGSGEEEKRGGERRRGEERLLEMMKQVKEAVEEQTKVMKRVLERMGGEGGEGGSLGRRKGVEEKTEKEKRVRKLKKRVDRLEKKVMEEKNNKLNKWCYIQSFDSNGLCLKRNSTDSKKLIFSPQFSNYGLFTLLPHSPLEQEELKELDLGEREEKWESRGEIGGEIGGERRARECYIRWLQEDYFLTLNSSNGEERQLILGSQENKLLFVFEPLSTQEDTFFISHQKQTLSYNQNSLLPILVPLSPSTPSTSFKMICGGKKQGNEQLRLTKKALQEAKEELEKNIF